MIKKWINNKQFQLRLAALEKSELSDIYRPVLLDKSDNAFVSDFFVLDFEATGLEPKRDSILSMGWTVIQKRRVQWREAQHHLVQYTQKIPSQSVAIHHITEQEAEHGAPIDELLPLLLSQLSGKILVAHFADIEVGFLQQLCQRYYGIKIPLVVVDTLQLAFRLKYQHATHVPQGALNLSALRELYGLPRCKAHNALSDAVATAELLLVLMKALEEQQIALSDVIV